MYRVEILFFSVVLSFLSCSAFSAEHVSGKQTKNLNKVGVISGSADTLRELELLLQDKADAVGATKYSITSASVNNKASGTAVIYQ